MERKQRIKKREILIKLLVGMKAVVEGNPFYCFGFELWGNYFIVNTHHEGDESRYGVLNTTGESLFDLSYGDTFKTFFDTLAEHRN